ncbi:hypothetical protein Tco_0957250 [Tanacetum coccineum]
MQEAKKVHLAPKSATRSLSFLAFDLLANHWEAISSVRSLSDHRHGLANVAFRGPLGANPLFWLTNEGLMMIKFKEFNYLLKIDPDVLTNDIVGFKTYDEYKDGAYIVVNTLRYQDLEWYDALKDSELKEEALKNKAIIEGLINEDVESNNEDDKRYELCGNETHELPICNIRRFEMFKYSFGQDEEYVAIKENEYEDLTSTSKDACRAYQEVFRMMDEGWMVTRME